MPKELSEKFAAHFNSIKVRLEPFEHDQSNQLSKHFNSIKVRLEPEARKAEEEADYTFQFHKGAIRTSNSFHVCLLVYYFNSIKVRLELL